MKYNALLDRGQPEKDHEVMVTQDEAKYTPYLNEIDTLNKELSISRGKIFKIKSTTIKNMFYSGIKIPSLWTTKQNYRDVLTKVISNDNGFLEYVSKNEMRKSSNKDNNIKQGEIIPPKEEIEDREKKKAMVRTVICFESENSKYHNRSKSLAKNNISSQDSRPISTKHNKAATSSHPQSTKNMNNGSNSNSVLNANIDMDKGVNTPQDFESIRQIPEPKTLNPQAYLSGGFDNIDFPKIDPHGKINFNKTMTPMNARRNKPSGTGAYPELEYERKIRTATAKKTIFAERVTTGSLRGSKDMFYKTHTNSLGSNNLESPKTKGRTPLNRKENNSVGPFLNVVQIKKIELKNPEVRKLLEEVNNLGPYFSHCLSCNNRNLRYVSELRIQDVKNYTEIIKNSDHRASQLIPGFCKTSK